MGNKGQVIKRGSLKRDSVEAGFQVQHTYPLSPPELPLVPPHVVELVLVLSHPFVNQDNVLTHPIRLPGLYAWY